MTCRLDADNRIAVGQRIHQKLLACELPKLAEQFSLQRLTLAENR